jgi:hypothetical protein
MKLCLEKKSQPNIKLLCNQSSRFERSRSCSVTIICLLRETYTNEIVVNSYFMQVWNIGKVKCTLVQALRLCTGRTAQRRSRGIALLFHDYGTRREWEVSVMLRPLFTLGRDPVPFVQKAGWAQGPVLTGEKNLIRSPDRPSRRQSLYRLR